MGWQRNTVQRTDFLGAILLEEIKLVVLNLHKFDHSDKLILTEIFWKFPTIEILMQEKNLKNFQLNQFL